MVPVAGAPAAAAGGSKPPASASKLRNAGDTAFSKGDHKAAIKFYSQAIKAEPKNEKNYYKRFRVYLRKKQYGKALRDIEKSVEVNGDFMQGRVQRGRVLQTVGRCGDAVSTYMEVLQMDPADKTATRELPRVQKCAASVAEAKARHSRGDFAAAADLLQGIFDVAAAASDLHLLRSECLFALGRHHEVLAETGKVLKLEKKSLAVLLLRGRAYYTLAEHDMALRHYREGLKYDPEHRAIKAAYRIVKKQEKLFADGESELIQDRPQEALAKFVAAAAVDSAHAAFNKKAFMRACHCHIHLKDAAAAVAACDQALAIDDKYVDAAKLRAQAFDVAEDFDEAVRAWTRAHELNREDGEIREKLQKAQAALKQSKEKNYYKILGVPRDANARQIKKAYRVLALKYHPDKQKTDDEKAEAEKKFQEIGEANEVLSNEELRAKYDRGEDVFENQGGGGGRPGGFHFPFSHFGGGGGGGQHFSFSFG